MYAMMVRLEGRKVLVVGGGRVALRKVRALVARGAVVQVVAPDVEPQIGEMARAGALQWESRSFEPTDCGGQWAIFAATDDAAVNDAALVSAKASGAMACLSGPGTEEGDFTVPAVLQHENVLIAVATGIPAVTVALRNHLSRSVDPAWDRGVAMLRLVRTRLLGGTADERARVWRRLAAALPAAASSPEAARTWLGSESALGLDGGEVEDLVESVVWEG